MKTRKLIAMSLISAFASAAAFAGGDVRYYSADELPDPSAVARILGGAPSVEAPVVKMRSVRTRSVRTRSIHLIQTAVAEPMAGEYAATMEAPVEPAPVVAQQETPSGLALPVQFEFDSAAIQKHATPQIDAVAEGIKLAGSDIEVVIEGHTDAQGSYEYNRRLSLARAKAVKSYLIVRHGIDPEQLRVEGIGEASPADPENPYGPKNRRVEFRAARG